MKRTLIAIFLLGALMSPAMVHAQSPTFIPESGTLGPCDFRTGEIHFDCVPVYIGFLVTVAAGFAGGFFFFGIILGGYKFALKSASQEKQAGLQQLQGAFIGIIVVVFSYLIVDTILRTLT